MSNKYEIYEYVKRSKQIVGILYATVRPDKSFGIGYALCTKTAADKFNKEKMFEIANGRALKCNKLITPFSIHAQLQNFMIRCLKYYKDRQNYQFIPIDELYERYDHIDDIMP